MNYTTGCIAILTLIAGTYPTICMHLSAQAQPQKKQNAALFLFIAEDDSSSFEKKDAICAELEMVQSVPNVILIATDNIASSIETPINDLQRFSFLLTKATVFGLSSMNLAKSYPQLRPKQLPFIGYNHFFSPTTYGHTRQALEKLTPYHLNANARKVIFLSGHGQPHGLMCGTEESEFENILNHCDKIAKFVLVQTCFASTNERLQRYAAKKYSFTLAFVCIGDTLSRFFGKKVTPADYQHAFESINQLRHPIAESDTSVIYNALKNVAHFENSSCNIVRILYPHSSHFKLLTPQPYNNNKGHAKIGNIIALEHEQVNNVCVQKDERIALANSADVVFINNLNFDNSLDLRELTKKFLPSRRTRDVVVKVQNMRSEPLCKTTVIEIKNINPQTNTYATSLYINLGKFIVTKKPKDMVKKIDPNLKRSLMNQLK